MSQTNLRIRRATTDDFRSLQLLWNSMHLPSGQLEKRLTEFQVVETGDGHILGAIGIQITGQYALLHSEGYTDFAVADAARQLFWERIQTITAHYGVFRLWTQENSPFWVRWGFQPAATELLERLPAEWKQSEKPWLTCQLKDEAALVAAERELEAFLEEGKKRSAETVDQARSVIRTITVIAFALAIILIGIAFYLFARRGLSLSPH